MDGHADISNIKERQDMKYKHILICLKSLKTVDFKNWPDKVKKKYIILIVCRFPWLRYT